MLRFTVTGVCLLSLLACIGTAWLWWREQYQPVESDGGREWTRSGWGLTVARDCATFYLTPDRARVLTQADLSWELEWGPRPPVGSRVYSTAVYVHYGWLMSLTAAPPLLWLSARARRRHVRRRRARLGLCLACGYSLRGNASGVCPECGAPTPQGAR